MEVYIFFFIIAVLFTLVGYGMGRNKKSRKILVAACIDQLIEEKYLKTQGVGNQMVILKWNEWNDDVTDSNQS